MPLKETIQGLFPSLPDVGAIQSHLDDKFEDLIGELRTMEGTLVDILAELRKKNGGAQ